MTHASAHPRAKSPAPNEIRDRINATAEKRGRGRPRKARPSFAVTQIDASQPALVPLPGERLLRAKEAAKFLGISVPTLFRWRKEGNFARPIHLGARTVCYRLSDLQAFISSRMAA